MAQVEQIFGNGIQVLGNTSVRDTILLGLSTTAGASRTIQAQGSATDIDIILTPKGTGRVVLNAAPTSNLHATTKLYVDNLTAIENGLTRTSNILRWEGPLMKHTVISGVSGTYDLTFGSISDNSQFRNFNVEVTTNLVLSSVNQGKLVIDANGSRLTSIGVGNSVFIGDDTDTESITIQTNGGQLFMAVSSGPTAADFTMSAVGDCTLNGNSFIFNSISFGSGLTIQQDFVWGGGIMYAGSTGLKVGAGTIQASSIAEFISTTKAIKLPLLTNAAAVVTPVNGMIGYSTALNKFIGYENGTWVNLISTGYQIIEAAGSALTQRSNLNILNGLTASDTGSKTQIVLGGPLTANISFTGSFNIYISSGNFGIGHTSLTSATRIDVKGATADDLAYSYYSRDSNDARTFTIRNDGALLLGTNINKLIASTANASDVSNSGGGWLFLGDSANINIPAFNFRSGSITVSSGTKGLIGSVGYSFAPTDGTASFTLFNVNYTINTSGTYVGTVIGFDYNPILSGVVGLTHYAARFRSGIIEYAGATQDDALTKFLVLDGSNIIKWRASSTVINTPGGATNEIQKNSGSSTFSGTKIFSSADGDIAFGDSGLAGSSRNLSVVGSAADITLILTPKGAGVIATGSGAPFRASQATGLFTGDFKTDTTQVILTANSLTNTPILLVKGARGLTTGGDTILSSGDAVNSGNNDSGNTYITVGAINGTGKYGNVGFFTIAGSFGSGEKVIYLANAAVAPSGSPTDGVLIYSKDVSSSAELFVKDEAGFETQLS